MCRRFNVVDEPLIHELLGALRVDLGPLPTRYNLAPTDQVPVIHHWEGQRTISDMRWGLIPHWARVVDSKHVLFNARSATIRQSRAYAGSLDYKRALVPATSYIEWRRHGSGIELLELRPERIPLVFAAVWDYWTDDVAHVLSCSILTVDADPEYAGVHARMPLMLDESGARAWLDERTSPSTVSDLMGQRRPAALVMSPIDARSGDARTKLAPRPVGPSRGLPRGR